MLGQTHLQLGALMIVLRETNCDNLRTFCHASCSPMGLAQTMVGTVIAHTNETYICLCAWHIRLM